MSADANDGHSPGYKSAAWYRANMIALVLLAFGVLFGFAVFGYGPAILLVVTVASAAGYVGGAMVQKALDAPNA